MQPESLSPYSLSVHKYNTLSMYAATIVNVCCTVLGLHDHFHAIKLSDTRGIPPDYHVHCIATCIVCT